MSTLPIARFGVIAYHAQETKNAVDQLIAHTVACLYDDCSLSECFIDEIDLIVALMASLKLPSHIDQLIGHAMVTQHLYDEMDIEILDVLN
ncbi:hypothetical protein Hypma_004003 [Hypsizygus marmoreus]|uniref:Uncharacterized protein n=1 Tax=Hypsizygus marmoreus TaxID=39966 RepID=A0A369J0V3_HYPMA|nr:hypothetical protein Hypma_004003 [Hypsizygus marmoreus]